MGSTFRAEMESRWTKKKHSNSFSWLQFPPAINSLAEIYRGGYGIVEKDRSKEIGLWLQSANLGNSNAQMNVAQSQYYLQGHLDKPKAIFYATLAYGQNDKCSRSAFMLGKSFYYGDSVATNHYTGLSITLKLLPRRGSNQRTIFLLVHYVSSMRRNIKTYLASQAITTSLEQCIGCAK